nr:hypothetical protein [Streptomyces yerevanensis]
MSFGDPGAPGQGQTGGHRVEVLAEETGEALHGLRRVLLGLPDPLQQKVTALLADKIGERPSEIAGPGDVGAGEPDLKESLVLAFGERLTGPHDPRGDFARARGVGPDRFGGARAEGGEVFADDLAAAAVAASLDLQEQAGAADLALGFGEAGVEVCLIRSQQPTKSGCRSSGLFEYGAAMPTANRVH